MLFQLEFDKKTWYDSLGHVFEVRHDTCLTMCLLKTQHCWTGNTFKVVLIPHLLTLYIVLHNNYVDGIGTAKLFLIPLVISA